MMGGMGDLAMDVEGKGPGKGPIRGCGRSVRGRQAYLTVDVEHEVLRGGQNI